MFDNPEDMCCALVRAALTAGGFSATEHGENPSKSTAQPPATYTLLGLTVAESVTETVSAHFEVTSALSVSKSQSIEKECRRRIYALWKSLRQYDFDDAAFQDGTVRAWPQQIKVLMADRSLKGSAGTAILHVALEFVQTW